MVPPVSVLLLCVPLAGSQSVRIALPDGLPASFSVAVPIEGAPAPLAFEKVSVRAEGFRLFERRADGALVELDPPPVATYRGSTPGGASASATLADGALTALITLAGGERYAIEPAPGGAPGAHVLRPAPPTVLGPDVCRALVAPGASASAAPADGGGCLTVAEVAFDADFEFYQLQGASSAAVSQAIEGALNAANVIYARDVLIEHRISTTIVQAAEPDPYSASDPGQLLDQFRNHWVATQAAVPRDLAHLITGREMSGSIIGLAYLAVVCDPLFGYGLSQFNFDPATHADLLAHELGHNWSAPHCLDEPGTSVMCGGGTVGIGPVTEQLILNYKATLPCLEPGDGLAVAVPAHARDDYAELDAVGAAGTVDVLANDYDGNCDEVWIASFDPLSGLGGTVQLSPGTGPGGRDELLYAPPAGGIHGVDTFGYVADDLAGGLDAGTVWVTDPNPDLVGHYKLDETGGLFAFDASGLGHVGAYAPGVELGLPGADAGTGTAMRLDDPADFVTVANFEPYATLNRRLTVAAWVRPDALAGVQRVFANAGSWAFGLSGSSLRFTTAQLQDYSLGAALVPGEWTHVAAVFDADFDVAFYRNGLRIGTVAGAMPSGAAQSAWYVGSLDGGAEAFAGSIDDVQVYAGALTDTQVRCLYESAAGTPGFDADPPFLSVSAGGEQALSLCSIGAGDGGDLYFVLGTLSGTAPGFGFGGFSVPLNPDAYFNLTLNAPNQPPLADSFANLNPSGHATVTFGLEPGAAPSAALQTVHHAWALIDLSTLAVEWVSAAQALLFLP
ncbi:MAG: LamG-like jellyroll fold domain-containing protein [Planctomycetota bacterium]